MRRNYNEFATSYPMSVRMRLRPAVLSMSPASSSFLSVACVLDWGASVRFQVGHAERALFQEQLEEIAFPLREGRCGHRAFALVGGTRGRRGFLRGVVLQADRHHGAGVEVVLDGYMAMRELEVFLDDGKSRAHAAYVFLHRLDRRGESRQLRLVLVGDSRSLVGEADGVSLVEDRHDDFIEAGVDEILRNLADGGVGDGSAASLRIVERRRCERFDIFVGGSRGNLDDARRAAEIVVDGYPGGRFHIGEIERRSIAISVFPFFR